MRPLAVRFGKFASNFILLIRRYCLVVEQLNSCVVDVPVRSKHFVEYFPLFRRAMLLMNGRRSSCASFTGWIQRHRDAHTPHDLVVGLQRSRLFGTRPLLGRRCRCRRRRYIFWVFLVLVFLEDRRRRRRRLHSLPSTAPCFWPRNVFCRNAVPRRHERWP